MDELLLATGSWKLEADLWTQHCRRRSGTAGARTRRGGCARSGRIPAVVYGAEKDKAVDDCRRPEDAAAHPALGIRRQHADRPRRLDGGDTRVLVKEYQLDPIDHKLLHADFYQVAMDKVLTVTVPIVLKGEAEGRQAAGRHRRLRQPRDRNRSAAGRHPGEHRRRHQRADAAPGHPRARPADRGRPSGRPTSEPT